jgi:signal transduction histidine kinase
MSLQPGIVVCQELFADAVRRQQGAAAVRKLTIAEEMPAAPLRVFCDPRALGEVLIVLVSAAIRLTSGDRLTVGLRERGSGDQRRIVFELHGPDYERITGAEDDSDRPVNEGEEALALARRFTALIGGVLELQRSENGGCLALSLPAGGEYAPGKILT